MKSSLQNLSANARLLVPEKDINLRHSYYFLTPTRIDLISASLKKYMIEQKPYLNIHYSVRDLAKDVQLPAYHLSAYINEELGMNFNDFLNFFRVKLCTEFMQDHSKEHLNLKGLARACGFSNRNSLTSSFKKFTGLLPSHYKRINTVRKSK
jgi:AraC-like DNA-binding protein